MRLRSQHLDLSLEVGFGPSLSNAEAAILQMLRRIRGRLGAQSTACRKTNEWLLLASCNFCISVSERQYSRGHVCGFGEFPISLSACYRTEKERSNICIWKAHYAFRS